MTTTKEITTMHTYNVTDADRATQSVRAAYFQEEGTFVVFKDQKHATCFMIRSESVLSVRREDADF